MVHTLTGKVLDGAFGPLLGSDSGPCFLAQRLWRSVNRANESPDGLPAEPVCRHEGAEPVQNAHIYRKRGWERGTGSYSGNLVSRQELSAGNRGPCKPEADFAVIAVHVLPELNDNIRACFPRLRLSSRETAAACSPQLPFFSSFFFFVLLFYVNTKCFI